MLKLGIKGEVTHIVDEATTARTLGSGEVDLLGTPAMIALMEKAAWTAVAPYLPEGSGTVGTLLEVSHLKPTPIGMTVRSEAELIEVDDRRLLFRVTASDEVELIGEGIHERFIIHQEKFQAKAYQKGN